MNFRCMPGHLVMAESVPFGQHFTYFSSHPMQEMLKPRYWLGERNRLNAGDTIRICEVRDDSNRRADGQQRVLSFCDVLVVQSSREGVEFKYLRDVTPVPEVTADGEHVEPTRPREHYVKSGHGKAVWNLGKKAYEVRDGNRKVVDHVTDKDEAWAIAAGRKPIPRTVEVD